MIKPGKQNVATTLGSVSSSDISDSTSLGRTLITSSDPAVARAALAVLPLGVGPFAIRGYTTIGPVPSYSQGDRFGYLQAVLAAGSPLRGTPPCTVLLAFDCGTNLHGSSRDEFLLSALKDISPPQARRGYQYELYSPGYFSPGWAAVGTTYFVNLRVTPDTLVTAGRHRFGWSLDTAGTTITWAFDYAGVPGDPTRSGTLALGGAAIPLNAGESATMGCYADNTGNHFYPDTVDAVTHLAACNAETSIADLRTLCTIPASDTGIFGIDETSQEVSWQAWRDYVYGSSRSKSGGTAPVVFDVIGTPGLRTAI